MSLQTILTDISSELGIIPENASERAYLISKVSEQARQLYESTDIPGSLYECTFNIDSDAQYSSLVALPYYVGKIRGLRFNTVQGGKIPQNSMRPRYHYGRGWGANSFSFPWRKVRDKQHLKRDIVNASVLTFRQALVSTADVVINVTGRTENAERFTEVVTIPAGELEATCVGNYVSDVKFEKTAPSANNISVLDVENNELADIPNNLLSPSYTIVELMDANTQNNVIPNYQQFTAIDVLYKAAFVPFVNLYDEFPAPNCDRLIFYKFAELYWAQQPGYEQRAMGAKQAAKELLDNMNMDEDAAKDLSLQWEPNGIIEALNPLNMGSRYYGIR